MRRTLSRAIPLKEWGAREREEKTSSRMVDLC